MDGDSWFSTFVPRTAAKAPETPVNNHKRRVSLLKQPNVSHPVPPLYGCVGAFLIFAAAGGPG